MFVPLVESGWFAWTAILRFGLFAQDLVHCDTESRVGVVLHRVLNHSLEDALANIVKVGNVQQPVEALGPDFLEQSTNRSIKKWSGYDLYTQEIQMNPIAIQQLREDPAMDFFPIVKSDANRTDDRLDVDYHALDHWLWLKVSASAVGVPLAEESGSAVAS